MVEFNVGTHPITDPAPHKWVVMGVAASLQPTKYPAGTVYSVFEWSSETEARILRSPNPGSFVEVRIATNADAVSWVAKFQIVAKAVDATNNEIKRQRGR